MAELQTYRDDMNACAAHGRASADGLRDVVRFVVSTIGIRFAFVHDRMHAIREGDWSRVRNASMVQRATQYVDAYRHDLYRRLQQCETRVDVIALFVEVPGLDTIKAGFVAQLLGYDVGCMDTHNLKRFQLTAQAFTTSGLRTVEKRREKIAHYCDVCDRVGGAVYLWASWCELIAAKYPQHFCDGADASRRHAQLIGAK